jgi:hypothetical protein
MDLKNLDYRKKDESSAVQYAVSKTGNLFLGSEWAKRNPGNGVFHLLRHLYLLKKHGYNPHRPSIQVI